MYQLMHIFLLLCLMVCSVQASLASSSWDYDTNPGGLMGISSSSTSSTLLATEPCGGEETYYLAVYHSNTYTSDVLFGAMATFDVYGFPNLNNNGQISSGQIWVANEQRRDLTDTNDVQAGWMISPYIYGDSKTHFFTMWTVDDGRSTGCYDLNCDGFVPVNNAPITPGDILEPTNGKLSITVKISKKKDDGDWWLHFGYDENNLSPVGFWSKSVLTHLADHANVIAWGGYAQSCPGNPSPSMGNGQWPEKNSASVRNIKYVDANGQDYDPAPWPAGLVGESTNKKCYQVSPYLDGIFYYGGPGGCTAR